MELIKNLKSEKVFYFFKQISMIPRNSGNEKNISNYLLKFAKDRNLDVIQDSSFNIIIKKDATDGYEDLPPVIIQGHMDMVCVKSNDSNHDFKNDPLELKLVDNKYLYANNTTLGGDNGIAIAYGLAILDSDDIKHPKLEFVFTTEEETTMNGALNLDTSLLEGKILLNIDSEEEGVFTLGCAGGILMDSELLLEFEEIKSPTYKIEIGGLLGGHSGIQADRKRANANKLMARLLFELKKEMDINIISIDGGDKYNSIPNVSCSIISISECDENIVKEKCLKIKEIFMNEYKSENLFINIDEITLKNEKNQFTKEITNKVIDFLVLLPDGIQTMSEDIDGLVESSINLGIIKTENNKIKFKMDLRSSLRSKLYEIINKIEIISEIMGFETIKYGEYPEWPYNPNSKIKDLSVEIYKRLFNINPIVNALHAGLECGVFKEKLPSDVEIISFGPNIFDVHTINEHIDIESVERFYIFLTELLENIFKIQNN